MQNDAVLGVVPELSYSEGLSVTDVVIKFNINDEAVSDRLGVYSDDPLFDGVNRFVIFKYFEEDNILLPIETTYDSATSVSTHVDEVGTYCLIDMEKWVNSIENMEPGNYYLEDVANDPANIVFCIDTRDIIDSDSFDSIKRGIKEVVDDAFKRYTNIKVYVYYQKFGSNFKVTNRLLNDINGNNYFSDYKSAEKALDKLEKYFIKSCFWAYDFVEATQFMLDTCAEEAATNTNDDNKETKTIIYHIVSDQRVMGSSIKAKRLLTALENDDNIYVSTLCPFSDMTIDELSYVAAFAKASNGIVLTASDYKGNINKNDNTNSDSVQLAMASVSFLENNIISDDLVDGNDEEYVDEYEEKADPYYKSVRNSIIEILGEGNDNTNFRVITSTGLLPIKLDTPLRPQSYYDDMQEDATDTDKDGLSDWDEVDTIAIAEHISGNIYGDADFVSKKRMIANSDLPTLMQRARDIFKYKNYIVDINKWFEEAYQGSRGINVLPIRSIPVDADSDNDGVIDKNDSARLDRDIMKFVTKEENVTDFEKEQLRETQKKYRFYYVEGFDTTNMIEVKNNCSVFNMPFEDAYDYEILLDEKTNIKPLGMLLSHEKIDADKGVNKHSYWVKIFREGKFGYIKCENLKIDVNSELIKLETKPLSRTIKYHSCKDGVLVAFERWYYPYTDAIGVDKPVPRFIQKSGGPCFSLSIMMGAYYLFGEDISPDEYLENKIDLFYKKNDEGEYVAYRNGIVDRSSKADSVKPEDNIPDIIEQLKSKKPVIISGNSTKTYGDHFALVVGYKNNGDKLSDFIVIDPFYSYSFPTTMSAFHDEGHYNNPCMQLDWEHFIIHIFN